MAFFRSEYEYEYRVKTWCCTLQLSQIGERGEKLRRGSDRVQLRSYQPTMATSIAGPSSLAKAAALPPTPPLNPLDHLLCGSTGGSTSSDEDDEVNVQLNGQQTASSSSTKVSSRTKEQLVPDQHHSIIQERAIVRYHTDPRIEPRLLTQEEYESESNTRSDEPPQRTEAHIDVSLLLDVTSGCGGKVWPAARVLGNYILSKREEYAVKWKGKTIVELGSGTGLVGFLVAKMELGTQIWVTDQTPMLPLMSSNLSLNPTSPSSPCYVAELDWGHPIPPCPPTQPPIPPKPDILLLADCVYLESAFQPLVDAMWDLSTTETEILFCYQKRRKADKRFFTLLKKRFTFEEITDEQEEVREKYYRQGTRLYWIKKKELKAGGRKADMNVSENCRDGAHMYEVKDRT